MEEVVYKKCTNPECKNPLLPATGEYFYKQKVHSKKKGTHYKLSSRCKFCLNEERKNTKKRIGRKYV